MAANRDRRHLRIDAFRQTASFRPRVTPRELRRIKQRERKKHGEALLTQLRQLVPIAAETIAEQKAYSPDVPNGVYLTFASEPEFTLKSESLDRPSERIELLSLVADGKQTYATVFVPEGGLVAFERLVQDYLTRDSINKTTGKRTPRNRELIDNIANIRQAALRWLWTDDPGLLPANDTTEIWWEVWLRAGEGRESFRNLFRAHAGGLGMTLGEGELHFPERTVLTARGTRAQLLKSVTLLNCIAELRRLKETADLFPGLPPTDQWQWSQDLVDRVQVLPAEDVPFLCVVDTGITIHPLLEPILASEDCHTIEPAWGTHDTFGHGTQMAGLGAYGDLVHVLPESGPIDPSFRLESVKILRMNGDNEGKLYGALTREAIARAEINHQGANRVFCMAIGSAKDGDVGRPSTWSASLDRLSSGGEDGERRLFVVSAGNVPEPDQHDYPSVNGVSRIHDPGQSWNALTVGAITFKDNINASEFPGYHPIAPMGSLSPYSCTSLPWSRSWPTKPDVVFEGGNRAFRPDGDTDSLRSLDLLSVHHEPERRPFDTFWGTSAATALAGGLAATIRNEYRELWPETVRGLIVHSARWTNAMLSAFVKDERRKSDIESLIRHCGFGLPSRERALRSATDSLTLIAQQEFQPFEAVRATSGRIERVRNRDIHLFSLPWPTEQLEDLGGAQVELRVVLSYFIEPNPSERGWTQRYRYESHGLRFAVKKPLESELAFRSRLSDYAKAEEEGALISAADEGWIVGSRLRHRGSLHADIWRGSAVELAAQGAIAVFPTLGWWRERPSQDKYDASTRYALLVSIETEAVGIDLYTPVEATIATVVQIGN